MYHNIPTWQEKLTSCAGEKDHQSRMSQLVYIIIASRAKLTLLSSLEGHYEHELRLDNYFFNRIIELVLSEWEQPSYTDRNIGKAGSSPLTLLTNKSHSQRI